MKNLNKLKISIMLGLMCMFLTCGIFVQINTVNNSTTGVGKTQVENELRDSVLRWKEKYENLYNKSEKKEKELEELRQKAANSDESSKELSQKLEKYNTLLGYTDLEGAGLIITLDDGDSSVLKGNASNYIVHDGDLLEIVNELKNAGAEAISINGERITNRSGIECVGNVITVNGEKVGAPFVIKAIGLTSKLYGAIARPMGYAELLEGYGVKVKIEQVEKNTIKIPKYNGVYRFKYAENVEE